MRDSLESARDPGKIEWGIPNVTALEWGIITMGKEGILTRDKWNETPIRRQWAELASLGMLTSDWEDMGISGRISEERRIMSGVPLTGGL